MTTLLSCQPPPPSGHVTVLEHECQFVSVLPDDDGGGGGQGQLSMEELKREETVRASRRERDLLHRLMAVAGIQTYYSDIEISCERDATTIDHLSLRDAMFLPVANENPWKRVWNTWRDEGIISALREVTSQPRDDDSMGGGLPSKIATYILAYIDKIQNLKGTLSPRSQMSTAELADTYSQHSNWERSCVRAIALHPRLPFIAIGRQDNLLEIKSLNQPEQSIFLKDKNQVGIVCLEWAPHCNSLLAVGVSSGVLLWNVDPTATTTRFLASWVRVETSPGHTPITSLSWSPHGNFLVSASPADNSLITWDIPMGVATRIKRAKGGGLNQVLWSPDSQKIFAASVESVFRIWETQNWTCEKWTNFCGRCKAACWSPKGDVLLFALEDDPALYYLSFRGYELAAGSTSAIKCADLSPCNVTTANGEHTVVGGNVQSLAWDPMGERLAVLFTPDSPSANLVVVLRTRTSHVLEIVRGGFIRGREGELPSLITFKPNYTEGALLATVWSGSRISFTPMSFQACSFSLSPATADPFPSPHPEQLAATNYADTTKFPQQQPHLSGHTHPGSGRSTPLQSLGRARLREHVATPLYSTLNS